MSNFGAYKGLFDTLEAIEQMDSSELSLSFIDSADKIIKLNQRNPETGITTSVDLRLAIVKPTIHSKIPTKQEVNIYEYINSPGIIHRVLKNFRPNDIIAVDIETNGTQAADPSIDIVGIGIASDNFIAYFDFSTNVTEANKVVLDWLSEYQGPIVGHNVFFDGTFLLRETGKWLNWKYDTYGLYRQLSNEGYAGQSYGLKNAQIQLLNWDVKGDVELDEWLVRNGYINDMKKDHKPGYYPGPDAADGTARFYKPSKGMMYKAPAAILGYYCGLDAASTLDLLTKVFLPSINGQAWEQTFTEYHCDTFMKNIELLGNQQLTGITIDKPKLEEYKIILEQEIIDAEYSFLNHKDIRPFADILKDRAVQDVLDKEPEKYKKLKLPKEPAKFKKDGTVSKAYLNWEAKMVEINETGPTISKNWENWNIR